MDHPIMSHNAAPTISGTSISNTNKLLDAFTGPILNQNATAITTPYPLNASTSFTNGQVSLVRVLPLRNMVITHMGYQQWGVNASNNDTIDFGIYTLNGNGTTIDLVARTGATAGKQQSTYTAQTTALTLDGAGAALSSYTLTAGTPYFLALVPQVTGTAASGNGVGGNSTYAQVILKPGASGSTVTQNTAAAYLSTANTTLPTSITMSSCSVFTTIVAAVARTQA